MVLTIDGKNLVRDLLVGDTASFVDQGGVGTDSTTPAEADTGLNSNTNLGSAGTIFSTSKSKTDKQVEMQYVLPSTAPNATYKEFGLSSSGASVLFSRLKFTDIVKGSTEEFDFSEPISIR